MKRVDWRSVAEFGAVALLVTEGVLIFVMIFMAIVAWISPLFGLDPNACT